jgi:poly(3-hydroxybutyrate) depolymerase
LACGGSGQSGDGDDTNGGDGDGDLDGTGASSSSDGGSGTGSDSGAGGTSGDSGGNGNLGSGGSSTPSSGCGSDTELTDGLTSINVDGNEREYILRLPDDYDSSQSYPLVFTWHPLGGSAEFIANMGYYGLVDASGGQAIFVSPQGLEDEGGDRGWWNTGGQDMDFYHAMLDLFTSELCFDEERIFSTGFSFGAMFSFTLACSEDSGVRAIAPQAGSAFGGCGGSTRPVATFGFIGVDDSLLDGHRSAMQSFVERNGCSEPLEMETSWCDGINADNLPCTCWEYQGCDAGYPVIECEYNEGHNFAPNSGDTIWEFFSQF